MELKICPILKPQANYLSECICIGEECIWWDPKKKNCAINILVDYFQKLDKEKILCPVQK